MPWTGSPTDYWVVVVFSTAIVAVIVVTILLCLQRNKLIAVWLKIEYIAFSCVGICLVYATHILDQIGPDFIGVIIR